MAKKAIIKKEGNNIIKIYYEALNEARRQFDYYVVLHENIKRKIEIYFLICSGFIALPLSSDYVLEHLFNSNCLLILFIIGILFLFVSIVFLILTLTAVPISLTNFYDLIDNIKEYSEKETLKTYIDNYKECIQKIKNKLEIKSDILKIVKWLIISGILFIVASIILLKIN